MQITLAFFYGEQIAIEGYLLYLFLLQQVSATQTANAHGRFETR